MKTKENLTAKPQLIANMLSALPFNASFSFSIHNSGQLPARYAVDTSQFNIPGLANLGAPADHDGVIFPNQTIVIPYDLTGYANTDQYLKQLETQSDWISALYNATSTSNLDTSTTEYYSNIIINYGLIGDQQLNYKTTLKEGIDKKNCSIAPTTGTVCGAANLNWTVEYAQ